MDTQTTQTTQTALNMLYLASCALNGCVPDLQAIPRLDLKRLFDFCRFHSMSAIVYSALKDCMAFEKCDEEDLLKQWKVASAMACHREILFDEERARITDFMEKNGIWYLPLKGVIIKELYPAAGMRQMADNDILFDETHSDEVIEFMKSLGYSAQFEKNGIHGIYLKPPSYNFELHTALFAKSHGEAFYEYSQSIKNKLIKSENSCRCHLSDEDFYIYLTAHEYRHYVSSGTGLRSLMDRFVYISSKGKTLDWDYINSQLKSLEINEFEKQSSELAMKLFSNPAQIYELQLTDTEREMLDYYASCGTHGSPENKLKNNLKTVQGNSGKITAATRRKYLLKRLFPSMEWYRENAPFCYKHKWAVPFYLIYRYSKGLFTHGKSIIGEFKTLFSK